MGVIEIKALDEKIKHLKSTDPFHLIDISGVHWLNIDLEGFKTDLMNNIHAYSLAIVKVVAGGEYRDMKISFLKYTIEGLEWERGFFYNMFYVHRADLFNQKELLEKYKTQEDGIFLDASGKQLSFNVIESILERYCNPILQKTIECIIYHCDLLLIDLRSQLEAINSTTICRLDNVGKLTSFEVALRHWFLVDQKKENYINPKQVGEKYNNMASYKNIEQHYGGLDKKPQTRAAKANELKNVRDSLQDYPDIQKVIDDQIALI